MIELCNSDISKLCIRCAIIKSADSFHKSMKSKDGLSIYCKSCRAEIDKKSYEKSPERRYIIKKRRDDVRRFNSNLLRRYKAMKGCSCCDERDPVALDLHHVNDDKEDSPSNLKAYSTKTLKDEIRKCIVVCANCHRKIHAGVIVI